MKKQLNNVRADIIRPLLAATIGLACLFCSDDNDDPYVGNSGDSCPDAYTTPVNIAGVGSVSCGGETYKTVRIGEQIWMAENINYAANGSKCYGEGAQTYDRKTENYITLSPSEIQAYCAKYGRLYNWATAMALTPSCNSRACSGLIGSPHRGICPQGWHIPSNEDWDKLLRYIDGYTGTKSPYNSGTAGQELKAANSWNSCDSVGSGGSYACEDAFGFSALPSGAGSGYGGPYFGSGEDSYWWSASEDSDNSNRAYDRMIYADGEDIGYYNDTKEGSLLSVRCLQDE